MADPPRRQALIMRTEPESLPPENGNYGRMLAALADVDKTSKQRDEAHAQRLTAVESSCTELGDRVTEQIDRLGERFENQIGRLSDQVSTLTKRAFASIDTDISNVERIAVVEKTLAQRVAVPAALLGGGGGIVAVVWKIVEKLTAQ